MYLEDNSIYSASSNCTFLFNEALQGGAIYIISQSSYLNSLYCDFKNNLATKNGGAVYIRISSIYSNSSYCLFDNNKAVNDSLGAAVFINDNSKY